ncbi:MAG: hypothetical protein AB7F89_02000, partial [Pirellulaceae bacterium]
RRPAMAIRIPCHCSGRAISRGDGRALVRERFGKIHACWTPENIDAAAPDDFDGASPTGATLRQSRQSG